MCAMQLGVNNSPTMHTIHCICTVLLAADSPPPHPFTTGLLPYPAILPGQHAHAWARSLVCHSLTSPGDAPHPAGIPLLRLPEGRPGVRTGNPIFTPSPDLGAGRAGKTFPCITCALLMV
ncbi:hypothetical protein HYPBUDRAFT_153659 [Hyphopichia burtonii NRRL Y-1933]|uniref:Uncharacterized protein n=1 Tax=Hyphopichia burtonii NRRL Y-1933 TaxID=984485 RepID=A0A1E4RGE1_9ASCO|nr:hypothetical protein HYPBUDRAFT_153659 [Hyphopichia burtonii NRRL Y-1933]ODV66195.1 hypothetical protein HYPBUDRAFT_153659 [Hyphopichia burtonii NRRL Y-1933]